MRFAVIATWQLPLALHHLLNRPISGFGAKYFWAQNTLAPTEFSCKSSLKAVKYFTCFTTLQGQSSNIPNKSKREVICTGCFFLLFCHKNY